MARLPPRYRPLLALGAGLLAIAVVAPVATATRVHWNEVARDGKTPVVRFEVSDVTIGAGSWSAHVSFKNLSKQTIAIGHQFGVAFFSNAKSTDMRHVLGFAVTLTFSPPRPTHLRPGASWTGVIGGSGKLKSSDATLYARVVFGPLTNLEGQKHAVFWITDHALPIEPRAKGPVI